MAVTVRVIPFYAICIASAMLLALLTLPLQAAQLHAVPAPVAVLKLEGAVSPVLAAYVSHGIARAAHEHAQLIILTVDTPGGLDTSMREIIKSILASGVPVASFVSPGGARAASAGTFTGCGLSGLGYAGRDHRRTAGRRTLYAPELLAGAARVLHTAAGWTQAHLARAARP